MSEPRKKDIEIDLMLGVCVKDLDGTVLMQNAKCKALCGEKTASVCTDGCMKDFVKETGPIVQPISTHHRVSGLTEVCDAIVINTGQNLLTLLYPRTMQIQEEVESFKSLGLSSAEQAVLLLRLDGSSNKQIAEKLFISPATVKTHLNNSYKKLPAELKKKIVWSRTTA